jgi:hypothetical protein
VRFYLYVLPLLSVVGFIGCGDARSEVAKDKLLAQVDKVLGEIDVKKKSAEIGVRKMESGLDVLKKAKIDAKVRLVKVNESVSELEERSSQADKALGRLRDLLKDEKDAEINGKTFTVPELKAMAEKTIASRKRVGTELEGLKAHQKRLGGIAAQLEQRESDGREKIRTLKQHLEEIDAKAVALKSMQEASGLSEKTESMDFGKVEKQVQDLSTKIDVELAYHDEKANESVSEEKSLDTILRETSTTSDTVSEIDKILSGK